MIKRRSKSQAQERTKLKEFSISELEKDILSEAKMLKIPDEVAKTIANRATDQVQKWISKRAAVTMEDLNKQVAKELKKYNEDLAYVYQIRGTII